MRYTDGELNTLGELIDNLIIHMFSTPNERHVIMIQLKRAFELGTQHKFAKDEEKEQ